MALSDKEKEARLATVPPVCDPHTKIAQAMMAPYLDRITPAGYRHVPYPGVFPLLPFPLLPESPDPVVAEPRVSLKPFAPIW